MRIGGFFNCKFDLFYKSALHHVKYNTNLISVQINPSLIGKQLAQEESDKSYRQQG